MIQRQGHWMLYELKPRDVGVFSCVNSCFRAEKESIVTSDEKWIHYDKLKRRRSWDKPGHASIYTAKPNIYDLELLFCISWDQLMYFIMSYSNRTKSSREIAFDDTWCVWVQHWRNNGRYTSRNTTKWFCNMTTLGHMLHNRWKPIWKLLNGKFYPICHIDQTLSLSIITCSDQWHMAWLSSTSILMKMTKNGSTLG